METLYLCSGGLLLLPAVRDLPGHCHGRLLGRYQVWFMLFSHFLPLLDPALAVAYNLLIQSGFDSIFDIFLLKSCKMFTLF